MATIGGWRWRSGAHLDACEDLFPAPERGNGFLGAPFNGLCFAGITAVLFHFGTQRPRFERAPWDLTGTRAALTYGSGSGLRRTTGRSFRRWYGGRRSSPGDFAWLRQHLGSCAFAGDRLGGPAACRGEQLVRTCRRCLKRCRAPANG